MIFGSRITETVLINRLQSEVDYLREQNKLLMDRLVSMTDQRAFDQIKRHEYQIHQNKVEEIKAEKMTEFEIAQEKKKEQEKAYADKILNIQLSQMTRGE